MLLFILIRKVLPKNHLITLFPDQKRKINSSNSDEQLQKNYSERAMGDIDQALFAYNDSNEQTSMGISPKGEVDSLCEYFELYEKLKSLI